MEVTNNVAIGDVPAGTTWMVQKETQEAHSAVCVVDDQAYGFYIEEVKDEDTAEIFFQYFTQKAST